jgi:hypothetical protein
MLAYAKPDMPDAAQVGISQPVQQAQHGHEQQRRRHDIGKDRLYA